MKQIHKQELINPSKEEVTNYLIFLWKKLGINYTPNNIKKAQEQKDIQIIQESLNRPTNRKKSKEKPNTKSLSIWNKRRILLC